MKRIKLTIGMFALVAGTVGAFAFAPAPANVTVKSGDTVRHWFDANTNEYLGQRLESQQENDCLYPKVENCAGGYDGITTNEDDEIVPVGDRKYMAKKPN
uniref:hypothetical protein n=1 Tax=Pedobacter schmidteae TaxID=2201271 RepID=UPI000EB271CE|nr:hypothetical protein [Pedobacter schmidteae]